MGYSTDFMGEFEVTPTLKEEHRLYLEKFAETRRMARDPEKTKSRPDPLRKAAGLDDVGAEGGYFVNEEGFAGQNFSARDVVRSNDAPDGQPGLWCQWTPTNDGKAIVWDQGEKFYNYVEWLQYLIDHFLSKWGYKLNGEVEWQGEDSEDKGKIVVKDNVITTLVGTVTYDDSWDWASIMDRLGTLSQLTTPPPNPLEMAAELSTMTAWIIRNV